MVVLGINVALAGKAQFLKISFYPSQGEQGPDEWEFAQVRRVQYRHSLLCIIQGGFSALVTRA